MALVLYEENHQNSVLKHFYANERTFNFTTVGNVTVQQDWHNHGVAAIVWEAAIFLANFLLSIGGLKGRKILELGSGTGLTGIVACKLNAHVTFTDKPESLDILHKNTLANLNPTLHYFDVKPLLWGEMLETNCADDVYDMMIGADLVYDVTVFQKLIHTFEYFVNLNNKLEIWLCGKLRYKEKYDKFRSLLDKKFDVNEHGDADNSLYLLKISWKSKD